MGVVQIARDFFRLHHRGAALRQTRFLAGLGHERAQLLDCVPQKFGLAAGLLDARPVRRDILARGAPGFPGRGQHIGLRLEPAIGVEQPAMAGGVDQRPLVVLAVNLDEGRAEALEHLDADGLVVDERPGAAVGELDAAQQQRILDGDAVLGEDAARRMALVELEGRGDLALLHPVPHQAGVAARAERQREGVEQNRLAGSGLAGEHRKPAGELDVEALDQNDVADRESDEHESQPRPSFLKALLIQELWVSCGSSPPDFTSRYASLYQGLSGKLWPSTAAAVCASSTMPSVI